MYKLTQMYSSCTVCYVVLTEDEKRYNAERDNFNFPVCNKCLKDASVKIEKELKK